ncbi:malto-oligosyltrehalose synthase [Galbitalea sp. SE-J8]|uniref:malto-oligosyltrehalose synthase n=1 Tax=Galbitalea sp. SE-J8 TaxID=3054952 RepID=UPI00259C95FA|nr:malto-oligosyltrehalose synthase [Galbitalea sp. SE-J8]MDM4764187.1 malto-oligosyltrehalose synthase [Galbitalea sp. SE-J8]
MSRVPISTYRLQIRAGFDLGAAARVTDYLASLGVDWAYLSPLLAAEPGSDHGYDVVDPSRVDPERGGAEGLERFAAAARAAGLGILVDIVPNHMGVATPRNNAWWWDVLARGRASRFAEAFDIDWDFGEGRIRIPVLGGDDDLDALTIETGPDGAPELAYVDHRFPIAAGTADGTPRDVHDRQHYELIDWRRADDELNYRRFFAVNSLAAIRVELPRVFEESHGEIARWVREGLADGIRVDHPDGLADPGGYLDALAAATGGAYVLVEKILEGDEELPPFWATDGTTGYDALADVDRVLVDPLGRHALDELDTRLRGRSQPVDWATLIHRTKRAIADGILHSEVLRLERVTPDPNAQTADALAELLACFPVYRSYLPTGVEHLAAAGDLARRHRPELADELDRLQWLASDPTTELAVRFQQTSGMVMAKGVEDTAFYRYSRLPSLTEVGADPSEFSIGVGEFHRRQGMRQASFPRSQTTLSTHDTKRGEDTRARIAVLAEVPERWEQTLGRLRELAPIGDGPFENLLWGSAIGAWPLSRDRLHAYAEKASREAGDSTTWTEPAEEFEERMHAAVDAAFDDERVAGTIAGFVDSVAQPGWSNALAAKLIQLTAPGVPDVYQGSELWETSLVDPDNRRPVDFDERRLYLAAIDAGAHPPIDETGAAKLLVVSRALRLRRDRPELFTRYIALPALGERARHVVAFDRGGAITVATRLPAGLADAGGWGDTTIVLPRGPLVDVFTGVRHAGGETPLAELLARYPVSLLAPADADGR